MVFLFCRYCYHLITSRLQPEWNSPEEGGTEAEARQAQDIIGWIKTLLHWDHHVTRYFMPLFKKNWITFVAFFAHFVVLSVLHIVPLSSFVLYNAMTSKDAYERASFNADQNAQAKPFSLFVVPFYFYFCCITQITSTLYKYTKSNCRITEL